MLSLELPERLHLIEFPDLRVSPRQIAYVSRLVVDRENFTIVATLALFAERYRWGLANAIMLCVVFNVPPLVRQFVGYGYQRYCQGKSS